MKIRIVTCLLDSSNKRTDILIYIHIPFCDPFCYFCSYYEEPLKEYSYADKKAIFDAYAKELEMYAKREFFKGAKVKAIQFGGGTPSAIEPEFLDALLCTINQHFDLSECKIVSYECNVKNLKIQPITSGLINLGINRFSFGIQTFNGNIRKRRYFFKC